MRFVALVNVHARGVTSRLVVLCCSVWNVRRSISVARTTLQHWLQCRFVLSSAYTRFNTYDTCTALCPCGIFMYLTRRAWLTPRNRVLENLRVCKLDKKLLVTCVTRRMVTMFTKPEISQQPDIFLCPEPDEFSFFRVHFSIILSSKPRSFKWGPPFRFPT